jgi:CRP/FNR family cyclic AMP-dependent transcriptional regulator
MACQVEELRHVPLFSLLDEDELAVLAAQVETKAFAPKERIYKAGEQESTAYVMLNGAVRVVLIDEEGKEVLFSEPRHGDIFGFASMLDSVAHKTSAYATEATSCLEIDRADLSTLLEKKPMAGLDMLTVLAREIHATQQMVTERTAKNANELYDEEESFGARIADRVASFGGSWTFIILFGVTLIVYTTINIILRGRAWDPYPFILLNLFLSMLAAIQAPVIMMSQNRQDAKDRVRSELDFEVNRRAETGIQQIEQSVKLLAEKLEKMDPSDK